MGISYRLMPILVELPRSDASFKRATHISLTLIYRDICPICTSYAIYAIYQFFQKRERLLMVFGQ